MSSTGGTGTFIKNLLSIHKESEIQTILCCDKFDENENMQKAIYDSNTELIKLPNREKIYKKSYFSILYELLFYFPIIKKQNPDLIIISTANPGWCFSFFFIRKPILYILHTPVHQSTIKNKMMFLIPKYFSNRKKIFYGVSKFVTNSITTNWGVNHDFVSLIYNPFSKFIDNVKTKQDKKIILTLGHVVDYKNPIFWIEIAEKITKKNNDVYFYWLGHGDLLSKCQELTKNNNRIKFFGYIENVEEYYKEAYIYLQPSIKESLGMSVIDAMQFSLPCIVSDVEGLPETIEDSISGFIINSNNVNAYVEKIQLLLDDDSKRVFLGNNAKLRSNKIFHPSIQKQSILNIYKKITNNIFNLN
jgi:glycosyltransferase involved in cell wall biosynthesis